MAEIKVDLSLQKEKGRGVMGLEAGPDIPLAGTLDEHGVAPYQMLLGALGYCLYWTLHEILRKQRVDFGEMDVEIRGEKKDAQIAHLEWAKVDFTIEAAEEDAKKIGKAMELAQKYCSVYYTLDQIADIEVSHKLK